MSRQNVEIVRRSYEPFERGDIPGALGSESRVPVEANVWLVHTTRARKVVRLDIYASKAEALEAVGLGE
jgi:hypothetical protein